MANFCKYCGKVLQDGEICSCPQAQAEAAQQYQSYQQPQQPPQGYQQPPQDYQQPPQGYQQPPQGYQQPPQGYQQPPQGYQQPPQGYQQPPQGYQQPPQSYQPPQQPQQPAAPNPFVLALKKLLPYIQSYVKAPVSAAQEVRGQNNLIFAGILLGIQAIAAALCLFSLLSAVCGALGDLIAGMMGLGGMAGLGGLGALAGFSIGPSIPMTLIFGILAAAAAIIIHVAIVFVITKILGVNRSFPEALVICGAHSPFVTVLLLVAFILNFLYLPLAMIFFLAAMLTWIVLSVLTLQTLVPAASQGKFWICSIVGVLAALLIGGWASWFLGSQSIGHITINAAGQKITVNDAMKEAGSSLGDIFENMLDDLF